jgi:calcium-dependent protein kinase
MVDSDIKISSALFVQDGGANLKKTYSVKKVLGQGAFGEVRVLEHRETKEKRAMKAIKKAHLSAREVEVILDEIRILKDLDHPNIVKIYEFFQD